MKFVDELRIMIRSGKGGPGAVSFRREKHVPRGGPDGGDGGRGGDIVFRVNDRMRSLLDLSQQRHYIAENGQAGSSQNKIGRDGEDLYIDVPPGTVVKDSENNILLDLSTPGEEVQLLKGGRGGKGNTFFKTSVNQAPQRSQPGEEGESREVQLELKLLADLGLLGFPNAGKSTLISRMSSAKPKIADYPFTTLSPNLGVVKLSTAPSFVIADIPGLIPGASDGVGLGIRFLKHIERTAGFIHVIDVSGMTERDPIEDFFAINDELKKYDEKTELLGAPLSERKQIVVLNKIDVLGKSEVDKLILKFQAKDIKVHPISAVSGIGIEELIREAGSVVNGK